MAADGCEGLQHMTRHSLLHAPGPRSRLAALQVSSTWTHYCEPPLPCQLVTCRTNSRKQTTVVFFTVPVPVQFTGTGTVLGQMKGGYAVDKNIDTDSYSPPDCVGRSQHAVGDFVSETVP